MHDNVEFGSIPFDDMCTSQAYAQWPRSMSDRERVEGETVDFNSDLRTGADHASTYVYSAGHLYNI